MFYINKPSCPVIACLACEQFPDAYVRSIRWGVYWDSVEKGPESWALGHERVVCNFAKVPGISPGIDSMKTVAGRSASMVSMAM